MKKKVLLLLMAVCLSCAGCGEAGAEGGNTTQESAIEVIGQPISEEQSEESSEVEESSEEVVEESSEEPEATPEPTPEVPLEGMYRSELTNEWISEELQDQRPVAIMVDNEKTALNHYGVNSADIVYEMMNSTANGRVTRLMCVVKEWQNITQFGSIRSVRPTNFLVAAEWNAILIHDGGPFYINDYVAKKYTNNLSGGFARFSNGKATEFTEYVTYNSYTNTNKGQTYSGLKSRIEAAKYSTTYNEYYPGPHFQFSNTEFDLSNEKGVVNVNEVDLPFPHNGSKLFYNPETKLYQYYEYGDWHIDALTGEITSFKNVIIQGAPFYQYDEHGYLIYYVVGSATQGWYLTNGQAIPVTWSKADETSVTVYNKLNGGEEITLNTGKTYIAIVPQDGWQDMEFK